MVGLHHRKRHGVWSSARLLCARYGGEEPPFLEARRSAVSLQVRCIDHQRIRRPFAGCQVTEDSVENTQLGPASETIVERLVRTVSLWRILPLQTIFEDVNNA